MLDKNDINMEALVDPSVESIETVKVMECANSALRLIKEDIAKRKEV